MGIRTRCTDCDSDSVVYVYARYSGSGGQADPSFCWTHLVSTSARLWELWAVRDGGTWYAASDDDSRATQIEASELASRYNRMAVGRGPQVAVDRYGNVVFPGMSL